MNPAWCSAVAGGLRLTVHITPNARTTEVIGVLDAALKLRLQAQPIEGKANDALIKFLAKALGQPRSAVRISHGLTSKKKHVDIACASLTPADAARLLLAQAPGQRPARQA